MWKNTIELIKKSYKSKDKSDRRVDPKDWKVL